VVVEAEAVEVGKNTWRRRGEKRKERRRKREPITTRSHGFGNPVY
jgi:hypothetical protein